MSVSDRLNEVQTAIFTDIRTNFKALLSDAVRDAHRRLGAVAVEPGEIGPSPVVGQLINNMLVEVLREHATVAVEEFTRRTGQPFWWEDEPEPQVDEQPMMHFSIDEKGNVTF